MDYNDNLCVNALNSVTRPPEIDEPFQEFFKPKPKLRIKQKTKESSPNIVHSSSKNELFDEDMTRLSIEINDLKIKGDKKSILEGDMNIEIDIDESNETKYVENINDKGKLEDKKNGFDDLFGNMSLSHTQNLMTRGDMRKRKLNMKNKEEFFSVITPISPYVISPKNNELEYKNINLNNKELTEKNIDILKLLIEIKEKELNNLNKNYSYEKSEYKLEIIRLKETIKENEENYMLLQKELVEKNEVIDELKKNLEKLEFDFISTKGSLEIMLDAERTANKNLRQELRMKNIGDKNAISAGENNLIDQQNYKYKYFEAMTKLQKLETELLLKKNYSINDNILNNRVNFNTLNNSLPIFVGIPELNGTNINQDQKLETTIEVCLNIKEDEIDNTYNNEELIQLISENRILHEDIVRLREELEFERNRSIVASIRQLTQKPIFVSSYANTRLSMKEIEKIELKAKLYQEKYEEVNLNIVKNTINLEIKPRILNTSLNIMRVNELEIYSTLNLDFKVKAYRHTNKLLTAREIELSIGNMNNMDQIIDKKSEYLENKKNKKIDFYNLAFENHDFISKILDNETIDDCNCLNVNIYNRTNELKHWRNKYKKIVKLIIELKSQIFEIRNLISLTLKTPPNLFEIIKKLIHNDKDVNETLISKETLLYDVSFAISEAYRVYLEYAKNSENIMRIQKKEWREYSNKLESQIRHYSREKIELLNEINSLKQILNQVDESKEDSNFNRYDLNKLDLEVKEDIDNINDEILSCYTFAEKENKNIDSEYDEWNIENLNIEQVLNSTIIDSKGDLRNTSMKINEETNETRVLSNDSDNFNQIIKLQGRIKSFRKNNMKCCLINENRQINNEGNSILSLRNRNLLSEINNLMKNEEENINDNYIENKNILITHIPHQINHELLNLEEFKGITGTTMMLRLYRYHKQTKTLEKQVMQLTKEKQELELEYEKDVQSIQMNLLSSKLIIEARDAEIKVLKEKCEFLNNKIEDDIVNIKLAAREEIEKVWKPKVEDFNNKCEDYLFKIESLESELLILRQQLAFQKQLNSKEFKQSEKKNSFIKSKYLNKSYDFKLGKSNELSKKIFNDFNTGEDFEEENFKSEIENFEENEDLMNINVNNSEGEQPNNHLTTLQTALSRLKSISNRYNSQ